jgi:hypothetical protein
LCCISSIFEVAVNIRLKPDAEEWLSARFSRAKEREPAGTIEPPPVLIHQRNE